MANEEQKRTQHGKHQQSAQTKGGSGHDAMLNIKYIKYPQIRHGRNIAISAHVCKLMQYGEAHRS